MDIRRLEAFRKVYELGSFSKAGQGLFLSQPTISAHVLSLEQELGTQLFDRLGRTIMPTQAGEILYRHVLQVFAALETARAEVELLQQKVAGELLIGGSTIPATYILPQRLAEFSRRYPDVRLRLTVGDSQDIISAVASGELALGVVGLSVNDQELLFSQLLEDQLAVLCSRKLPGIDALCEQGAPVIPVENLRQWPWVMREHGSGTRKAFELALGSSGLDIRALNTVIEARSHEAVVQCALHGLGLCVSSKLAVAPCIAKGDLIQVDVPGLTMQRAFHMVRHARRHVFPAMRYFMDFLKTHSGE